MRTFEKGPRKATINRKGDVYVVWFYYDGIFDYEWKRGAGGVACDVCKTLKQAEGKAKRYINK